MEKSKTRRSLLQKKLQHGKGVQNRKKKKKKEEGEREGERELRHMWAHGGRGCRPKVSGITIPTEVRCWGSLKKCA